MRTAMAVAKFSALAVVVALLAANAWFAATARPMDPGLLVECSDPACKHASPRECQRQLFGEVRFEAQHNEEVAYRLRHPID